MNKPSPTTQARRKQYVLLAGVLLGILASASIGVYFTSDSTPKTGFTAKADIKTKSYIAPGDKVDPQDAWRGVSDSRLTSMEAKLATLENENRILTARSAGSAPRDNAAGKTPGQTPEKMSDADLDRRLADYEKSIDKANSGYPAGTPSAPVPGQTPPKPARQAASVPAQQPTGQVTRNAVAPISGGILTVKLSRGPEASRNTTTPAANASDSKAARKTAQNYLPAGMFGQAILLSGLDAPTGGQAQSNPHPVLLQLHDLAVLPNRYRYDWAQCLITGAGYGDLSSERGYIRTESLSCVSKDGNVLDVPIKGYIVGEDGKAGIRGRLVSKQGQVLGNALLAGVVAGIGTGLERSSSVQSVSPLGSTTSIRPGQEFQSGVGSGVGRALDRLATYYIQLAEKMFPVIEIDAGRVVDIVLTQGVKVDVDPEHE